MYTRIFAWRWSGCARREITAPAWLVCFVRNWLRIRRWITREKYWYRDVIMP